MPTVPICIRVTKDLDKRIRARVSKPHAISTWIRDLIERELSNPLYLDPSEHAARVARDASALAVRLKK